MSELINFPDNPALLAALRAEEMAFAHLESTSTSEFRLVELEKAAEMLGFLGSKYLVESNRALSLPVSIPGGKTEFDNYYDLTFEGQLVTYSNVEIGRIIGVGAPAVRAVCLSFNNVTRLPYFETIPPDHLLHVPVLAVESMHPEAA